MCLNVHLYEKVLAQHHQDLQREIEHQHMLAHLPRHRRRLGRRAIGRLGVKLVALGSGMEQIEQRGKAVSV
jgi:hypothetical protein